MGERANIGINVFKEELCKGYGNKFYNILLHKFINLESLNNMEMITILSRTVYKINKRINLKHFGSIARKKSFNGQSMTAIKNSQQFANIFDALKCDSSVLENIYDAEMIKWQQTPTEYEHSSSRTFANLFGINTKPKTPSIAKSKLIKMFS